MEGEAAIAVELVYALKEVQEVVALSVPAGTTVREAITLSGLPARYPEIDAQDAAIGVHGRIVGEETTLQDGDRVEIYRPLLIDPRLGRRRRASRLR
jgi:putative ubiquitin-RnfH superfamily antitoxin RatB of RatAB toxin-antitoxin module